MNLSEIGAPEKKLSRNDERAANQLRNTASQIYGLTKGLITLVLTVSWYFRAKFFVKIMPVCQDNACQDKANTGVIAAY